MMSMTHGWGNRIRDSWRNSKYILGTYWVILVFLGISIVRSYFDYATSLKGARWLNIPSMGDPTLDWLQLFTLAAMPQVITIVGAYAFVSVPGGAREWTVMKLGALLIVIMAVVLDVYTGWLFYKQTANYPFMLSFVGDTIFSEVCLSLSFGLTVDLFHDAKRQLGMLFGTSARGSVNSFSMPKPKPRPQQSRNMPTGGPVRQQGAPIHLNTEGRRNPLG